MEQRIVFTGKQQVELETYQPEEVGSGQVGVKSYYSLLSTGTENIAFNQVFEKGTHWAGWVKYPFYPGYAVVGEVVDIGENVTSIHKGDLVALRRGHGSYHIVSEEECFPIPSDMDAKDATWFALAKITFLGAKAANYGMGENILVIGAGPVGQMTLRWAYALGAERIISTDFFEERLTYSRQGGASFVLDQPVTDSVDRIKSHFDGRLPDIVIDSTANPKVLKSALSLVKTQGKVVIMGDCGRFSEQELISDVVTRGITIVGAHDGLAVGEWNAHRIHRSFCNYVQSKRFHLEGLISHEFRPNECVEAYRTANEAIRQTMGILFNWR
ncbi:zinc-dependent alcohol dehydrogenase [Paenibacillus montanisoli]|uniref:zinc-dependent alcohol dehydrogenase n=1 Tax=Paenibacillus montanisoli TaxID=2081970 RepID=UPI0014036207|nr:zinc-binding alcohol dehydrogenase [Paenibacillus montanisoli]